MSESLNPPCSVCINKLMKCHYCICVPKISATIVWEIHKKTCCWTTLAYFIYLLLVKTNGVALLEPLRRAKDCSFPSPADSPPAPLPEKGQTPLALDPLPPILRDKAYLVSSWSFRSGWCPDAPNSLLKPKSGKQKCTKWECIRGDFTCWWGSIYRLLVWQLHTVKQPIVRSWWPAGSNVF